MHFRKDIDPRYMKWAFNNQETRETVANKDSLSKGENLNLRV